MNKMSIWVWHTDAPHGGYLFHGNPNRGLPPFHLGSIENLLCGESLVWEHTRRALDMNLDIHWWNTQFPKYKVKPTSIMVEIRPYRKHRGTKNGSEEANG